MKLSNLTKPEINYLQENGNFTKDELIIFNLLAQGKIIKEIANETQMSSRTVDRRIVLIKEKIKKI